MRSPASSTGRDLRLYLSVDPDVGQEESGRSQKLLASNSRNKQTKETKTKKNPGSNSLLSKLSTIYC